MPVPQHCVVVGLDRHTLLNDDETSPPPAGGWEVKARIPAGRQDLAFALPTCARWHGRQKGPTSAEVDLDLLNVRRDPRQVLILPGPRRFDCASDDVGNPQHGLTRGVQDFHP